MNFQEQIIGRCQLLKSATSIGANYSRGGSCQSKSDFIHKLGIVEKETNETLYWLERIHELFTQNVATVDSLLKECPELLAIFTASRKTAKKG